MPESDISWLSLACGSLSLIIPILIFQYYRTGLNKQLLYSFGRMIVQLLFVGVYLQYIFNLDSMIVNFAWVLIMMFAAAFTIVKRSELKRKTFILPVIYGICGDLAINLALYIFIVMSPEKFLTARIMIPIIGMVVGNCITNTIISLRSFMKILVSDENRYRYRLMAGATRSEALRPIIAEALRTSFAPKLASDATVGLIWLPGMMTGQILGGSDPLIAIKYQILILVTIFVGGVVTSFISLNYCKRLLFDKNDNLQIQ